MSLKYPFTKWPNVVSDRHNWTYYKRWKKNLSTWYVISNVMNVFIYITLISGHYIYSGEIRTFPKNFARLLKVNCTKQYIIHGLSIPNMNIELAAFSYYYWYCWVIEDMTISLYRWSCYFWFYITQINYGLPNQSIWDIIKTVRKTR